MIFWVQCVIFLGTVCDILGTVCYFGYTLVSFWVHFSVILGTVCDVLGTVCVILGTL